MVLHGVVVDEKRNKRKAQVNESSGVQVGRPGR
jgi:hypothetical protein